MSGQHGRPARLALGILGPALAIGCGVTPGPRRPASSAIGDDRAIPTLRRLMDTTTDPRVKVAAAAGLLNALIGGPG